MSGSVSPCSLALLLKIKTLAVLLVKIKARNTTSCFLHRVRQPVTSACFRSDVPVIKAQTLMLATRHQLFLHSRPSHLSLARTNHHYYLNRRQGYRLCHQLRCEYWPILVDDRSLLMDMLPQMPNQIEDYIHRIGRTGRAGAKGKFYIVLTFEVTCRYADATFFRYRVRLLLTRSKQTRKGPSQDSFRC